MALSVGDLVHFLRADSSKLPGDIKQGTDRAVKQLNNVGKNLTRGLTAPLVGFAAVGIKKFGDINKGLREVVSLTGEAGAQADRTFAEFRSGVEGLSDELGVAQSELVDGLYQSLSAGVPRENAFSFLEVASKAAIAGVATTEQAVDGITSAINAFGLGFDESERVADVFFSTVRNGKTTLPELASVIGQVAPAAKLTGVSLEETAAALSTLTANGLSTSEAGTKLRAAMTAITRPTEDLTDIFNALGFESAQAAIEQNGLQFALQAVSDSAAGDVGALTALLGSQEAVAATAVIAGSGQAKFAADLDAAANSAGAAAAAFDQVDQARNFERLQADIDSLAIRAGEILFPLFEGIVGFASEALDVIGELPDGVLLAAGGAAAALGPLLTVVSKLPKAFAAAKVAALGFNAVLSSGPLLAFTAAAAAATTAFVIWQKEAAAARDRAESYGEAIGSTTDSLGDLADRLNEVTPATQGLTAVGEGLKSVISDIGGFDQIKQLTDLGLSVDEIGEAAVRARDDFQDLNLGLSIDNVPKLGGYLGGLSRAINGTSQAFDEGVDSIVVKLRDLESTAGDESVRKLAGELANLGETLPEDEFFKILEGLDDIGEAADDNAQKVNTAFREFLQGAVLAGQFSQSQVDAAVAAAQLTGALDFQKVAAVALVKEQERLALVAELAANPVEKYATQQEQAAAAAMEAASANVEVSTSMEEVAGATSLSNDELEILRGHYDSMVSAALALTNAQAGVFAAIDSTTKALADNGATLDLTTEAGRSNNSALGSLTESYARLAAQTLEETGSQEQANAVLAEGQVRINELAAAAGLATGEVAIYTGALNDVPIVVDTAIEVDTSRALAGIDTILGQLDFLANRTTTSFVDVIQRTGTTIGTGRQDAEAAARARSRPPTARMFGGPLPPGEYIVGELRPEGLTIGADGRAVGIDPNPAGPGDVTNIDVDVVVNEAKQDPTTELVRALLRSGRG